MSYLMPSFSLCGGEPLPFQKHLMTASLSRLLNVRRTITGSAFGGIPLWSVISWSSGMARSSSVFGAAGGGTGPSNHTHREEGPPRLALVMHALKARPFSLAALLMTFKRRLSSAFALAGLLMGNRTSWMRATFIRQLSSSFASLSSSSARRLSPSLRTSFSIFFLAK